MNWNILAYAYMYLLSIHVSYFDNLLTGLKKKNVFIDSLKPLALKIHIIGA